MTNYCYIRATKKKTVFIITQEDFPSDDNERGQVKNLVADDLFFFFIGGELTVNETRVLVAQEEMQEGFD
jgi:hypothetical protein